MENTKKEILSKMITMIHTHSDQRERTGHANAPLNVCAFKAQKMTNKPNFKEGKITLTPLIL